MQIDRSSFVPIYHQLKTIVLEHIKKMKLKEGDKIPSENELCAKFQISRTPVRQAIRELVSEGFIYAEPGRGLFVASRINKKIVITLVVHGFSEESYILRNSVFGELIRGMTHITSKKQILLDILYFDADKDLVTSLRTFSKNTQSDGILIRTFGDIKKEDIQYLDKNIPYVVIKRHLEDKKINSVISDDRKGAFLATEHLILESHRRIGFIHGPLDVVIFRERLDGYKEALAKYDIEIDPHLIIGTKSSLEENSRICMLKLLGLKEIPTAVFITGDIMALGAYEAIKEKKLSIPHDISVVGYDDLDFSSKMVPSLTTIKTSYFEFGKKSIELLLESISSNSNVPKEVIITPTLILRESTRKMKSEKSI